MTSTTYNLARMNMILRGIPYRNFNIYNGDTLEHDYFGDMKFRVQVANPPYSANWSADMHFMEDEHTLSEQGIISPLYTCLVLQADISPSYLAWYFKSDAWYRYIYDNGSQGVRHDRVSMTDDLLMGIPVMYPSHVKQLLYADILDMVEARLQATQKTLELLSKTRDGYMRQLFI